MQAPPLRPPTEPHQREKPQSPLHPSLKVPGRWALLQVPQKNGVPMERDARLQSLFYISFRVPSKEALPPGSLHRAPTEGDTTPPETGLIKTWVHCTYSTDFLQVPGPSRCHTSFQDDNIQDSDCAQVAEDIAEEDTVPGTPPPPLSKKARYIFKRCFEATFNSQMIPGYDEVLAEDSDDESNKRTWYCVGFILLWLTHISLRWIFCCPSCIQNSWPKWRKLFGQI